MKNCIYSFFYRILKNILNSVSGGVFATDLAYHQRMATGEIVNKICCNNIAKSIVERNYQNGKYYGVKVIA